MFQSTLQPLSAIGQKGTCVSMLFQNYSYINKILCTSQNCPRQEQTLDQPGLIQVGLICTQTDIFL